MSGFVRKAGLPFALAVVFLMVLAQACGDGGGSASPTPRSPQEHHYDRGVSLSQEERWQEAIAEFDKAIALDPAMALAYSGRGHADVELGNVEQALADYDKAIELDPSLAVAYRGRGLAYVELGSVEQGIADLEKALELETDPNARIQTQEIIDQLKAR